jgi:Domain of unknown function (DUF5069)
MLGLYFLPRTIDKVRAFLPGGDPGEYFVEDERGMSAYVLRKIKVDPRDLSAAVAAAAAESDVEAWISANADLSNVEKLNRQISSITLGMMDEAGLATMRLFYTDVDSHPKTETVFEFLEADDAALVSRLGSGV